MKKNRMINVIGVGLLVVMIAATAVAQQEEGVKGRKSRIEKAFSQLNLTDGQKEEIKQLREKFRSDNSILLSEIKALRELMRQQMKDGDREGREATREQLKEKMELLREEAEGLHEGILALLTQEQRDQLAQMREKGKSEKRGDCKCKIGMKKMLAQLDLTDQQKEELAEMRDAFREAHADELEQLQALKEELKEKRENGDEAGAAEIRDRLRELGEKIRAEREGLREKMKTILTEDQKQKLEELRKDCREGRRSKGEVQESQPSQNSMPEFN